MPIQSIKSGTLSRSTAVGNAIILPGDFESIATVTVGSGGSGGVTFNSISATYTHLQIRAIIRGNRSGSLDDALIRFNGGSANITAHALLGNGSAASASGATAGSWSTLSAVASASETSGVFSTVIVDILDYANTNKFKTYRALSGYDNNGSGRIYLTSGVQLDTAAINSIAIIPSNTTFAQHSHFALYGIRG